MARSRSARLSAPCAAYSRRADRAVLRSAPFSRPIPAALATCRLVAAQLIGSQRSPPSAPGARPAAVAFRRRLRPEISAFAYTPGASRPVAWGSLRRSHREFVLILVRAWHFPPLSSDRSHCPRGGVPPDRGTSITFLPSGFGAARQAVVLVEQPTRAYRSCHRLARRSRQSIRGQRLHAVPTTSTTYLRRRSIGVCSLRLVVGNRPADGQRH
jgi:hypothetical protein